MDINLIKERLEASRPKPKEKKQYEKIDYSKIFWRPTPGKHQIRIVPSKFNSKFPFKEVTIHYGYAKFPIYALSNWGEKDPIEDFITNLKKSNSKESWDLAKKLTPKTRIMIPVIVRGEESAGVRLWEVGKTIYLQLLGLADDEDYGDYTDILEGRDFTVETVKSVTAGKESNSSSIRIKPKMSKLSDNAEQVEKWLSDQPDILSLQTKMSYDELKKILQDFLNPDDSSDEDEDNEEETESVGKSYGAASIAPKENKMDKFDSLFKSN